MELNDIHMGGLLLEAAYLEKKADEYDLQGLFKFQAKMNRAWATYMRERVQEILEERNPQ